MSSSPSPESSDPAAAEAKPARKKAPTARKPKAAGEAVAKPARKAAAPRKAPATKAKEHAADKGQDTASETEIKQVIEEGQPPVIESVVAPAPVETPTHIVMKTPIIVKDLAARLNVKTFLIIHDLMEFNFFGTPDKPVDPDLARKVCAKRGVTFEIEKRDHDAGYHKPKEEVVAPPPPPVVKTEQMSNRAPVIAFMGHVDHGKTSLMDAIRSARVAAGEAGGITQHIGAYCVERNGQKVTFLDTPGHAAFSAMRARGAKVTDIVVLVVAADDGLMPQTIEAIAHAQAAEVKIMVALNKIDLPTADPNKVKAQLQEKGLVPEEWGGDTIVCEVSATKKIGLDKLLENMLALAEIMELRGSPEGFAKGTVIEAQIEQGRGPTATVLVQTGMLKTGSAFVCGDHWGKVKAMFDDCGKPIREAGPSTPVKVIGFTGVPNAGDSFDEMKNDREARQLSDERGEAKRLGRLDNRKQVTLENIFETLDDQRRKVLKVVIKGDVQGSVEAIRTALEQIRSEKVSMEVVMATVGPISENDVMLSAASGCVIIGFNTRTESQAAAAAKREHVQIKLYSIIYELIDQVKDAMAGLLDPVTRESVIGTALVKQVIELSKFPVAGCSVQNGRIARNGRARVLRGRQPIYDGGIVTLKRFQDDVSEVRSGLECGIRLGDFHDYEVGDIVECYTLEKVPQQL